MRLCWREAFPQSLSYKNLFADASRGNSGMGIDRVPTTLVICCPVTPRTTADQLGAWVRRTRQAVVPVTWVTPIESLASTLDVLGGADRSGGVA